MGKGEDFKTLPDLLQAWCFITFVQQPRQQLADMFH